MDDFTEYLRGVIHRMGVGVGREEYQDRLQQALDAISMALDASRDDDKRDAAHEGSGDE